MTRSQRLDPLLRVVQQRQDDAARQLAERDKAQNEQEARLDALRRYAEEYAITPAGADGTIAPALLANRIAFRAKLDAAVTQQTKVVDQGRQQTEIERTRLMLASRDTKVLEKLAASYRAEEAKADDQRAQRELDDLGGRRAREAQARNDADGNT